MTNVRKTIPLNGWKSYGYKNGQDNLKKKEIESWTQLPGTCISEGTLLLDNTTIFKQYYNKQKD
ncbi:MAG: hypothetical protein LLG13_13025 [Bacteroidales bacterium]|nr:hypothetical protein [Bacteroidales bacterium]